MVRMSLAELSACAYLGSLLASFGIEEASAVIAGDVAGGQSPQVVTNISQFRALPSQEFLRGCPFHLTGIVTLVDTNRSLVVLQDGTGSVAVNLKKEAGSLKTGAIVSLQAAGSSPYVASFPDFPHRPSGSDLRSSFEAPSNWGDNHLTRMRGYLHPPVPAFSFRRRMVIWGMNFTWGSGLSWGAACSRAGTPRICDAGHKRVQRAVCECGRNDECPGNGERGIIQSPSAGRRRTTT